MSLISVSGLRYAYPGAAVAALDGVELEIEPGEFVLVAGGSGSGKSTLLRAISGLVPHFHGGTFAGHVRVAGDDTREHGPGQLARHVGTLFQDPESQIVMGTVRAELAFALENRGLPRAEVARTVEETALALALDGLLERPTAELSGGELQRVALGASVVGRPAVVCLDEPTSQLDPVAGDELIALLRRLNEEQDLTVVLAEHRLERCLPAADRVLALGHGRVSFDGEPAQFLRWALREAPELSTPGARLLHGLGLEPQTAVKAARASLRAAGVLAAAGESRAAQDAPAAEARKAGAEGGGGRARRGDLLATFSRPAAGKPSHRAEQPALALEGVWHELRDGPAILRGASLRLLAGERVALMGRNGAGKSTLLRHAAGLMEPTRGRLRAAGRVALMLQNPGDYLVHDSVAAEAPRGALERFGLSELAARHPRELSGGERQRLALAIVLGEGAGGAPPPAVVCLDEPTRGMDRAAKQGLAELLCGLDAAVLVATHDTEFAAAFAGRVALMADGAVIADAPAAELLRGGIYFSTETARILDGLGGVLVAEQALELLRGSEVLL